MPHHYVTHPSFVSLYEKLSPALYISRELCHLSHRRQKDAVSRRNAIKRTRYYFLPAATNGLYIKLRFRGSDDTMVFPWLLDGTRISPARHQSSRDLSKEFPHYVRVTFTPQKRTDIARRSKENKRERGTSENKSTTRALNINIVRLQSANVINII